MAYQRKAESLTDYRSTEATTVDDLLEVTFMNFQTIFVCQQGFTQTSEPRWVIHEDFVPSSLKKLREPGTDYSQDIKGTPFDVPVDVIATVGEQAEFYVHPGQYFKSAARVTSILPSGYRDAYHDDLELAAPDTH